MWVKNFRDSWTEFFREHLNDSLDKVAPELLVSPGFISLDCSFDKMFRLCANYTKGLGEVFCQWMMDNNSGELLLHVDRAEYGGRKDVTPIA